VISLCLLLFLLVFRVFYPITGGDFINYDDDVYVTDNFHVQGGLALDQVAWAFRNTDAANWHPVTWLSHMLDCQLYGAKPWGHHLTSVLIHALNAVLLFGVMRRMTGALWRSLFVALLFGLHPLRVESVAWIAERKDVLSTMFWLLALWAYARYAEVLSLKSKVPPREPGVTSQGSVAPATDNGPQTMPARPETLDFRPQPQDSGSPTLDFRLKTLDCFLWLLLPACASVLLLATTNKICQDVAVIPFLWVLPLALYLLSFILCFENPRWYRRGPFGVALAVALGGICWVLFQPNQPIDRFAVVLFICCMVCHGELYRLKPDPRHLTAYYLMIAAGGALGGLFVAVIAPLIFSGYYELHWGLLLCAVLFLVVCLKSLRPSALPLNLGSPASCRGFSLSPSEGERAGVRGPSWGSGAQRASDGRAVLSWLPRAACGLWAVGVVALGVALWMRAHQFRSVELCRARNFYGVLTVYQRDSSKTQYRQLVHGNVQHGLQILDPVAAAWPTTYYNERSGVGLALSALPAGSRRIGLVGLGIGTLAAYGQAGDYLRFYEINPDVVRLANSPFTYLPHCQGKVEVVLGDARLSLEREPPQNFDLLVLDAFSSDAIPVHLLTEEAFAVYQRHLKANGTIAVHITNGHLNLEPVVANLARRFQYASALIEYQPPRDQWWNYRSVWLLLSHNPALLDSPALRAAARPAPPDAGTVPLWTDDFASLFQILQRSVAPPPEPPLKEAEDELAAKLWAGGDFAGAMACYRRALELDPGLLEALNNLAWLRAACPDAALRNGAEAVQLAETACRLTEYHRTTLVGTLAAAYAEAGRFPEAVATAQKACELAAIFHDDALLARNRELLERYRAGQPYHEPAAP